MIIEASVNTKAVKRSETNKKDLRDFVGKLKLEATSQADMILLREMYNQCFGRADSKGSIKVFDAEGKEVAYYFYEKAATPVELRTKASQGDENNSSKPIDNG